MFKVWIVYEQEIRTDNDPTPTLLTAFKNKEEALSFRDTLLKEDRYFLEGDRITNETKWNLATHFLYIDSVVLQ